LIWFVLTLPFRLVGLGFRTGMLTTKVTHRSLRLLGYRRLLVFGAGVGVGLLLAPGPGTELRARLREVLDGLQGVPTPDLGSRVRDELASSPRTWHLPQPAVDADPTGRVTLTGDAPDASASADLERVARGVRGVVAVENRLTVAGAS
jgi:hypothetical protein